MEHFLNKIRIINLGDSYLFYLQLICFSVLFYFFVKSLFILFYDIRKQLKLESGNVYQKGFPALSLVYLLFSAFFIFFFITSFDEIVKIFINGYTLIYKARAGSESLLDSELSITELNCLENYRIAIKITLSIILSIFAINFSKAFFTLNSLEINKIGTLPLNEIFNNAKCYIRLERLIRFSIAVFFIIIEKQLYENEFMKENSSFLIDLKELKPILLSLSKMILILYMLLLTWIFLIRKFLKGNNLFAAYIKYTPFQLLSGLGIAIIFLVYSLVNVNNLFNWSFWVFIITGLSVLLFYFFMRSFFLIEKKYFQNIFPIIISSDD